MKSDTADEDTVLAEATVHSDPYALFFSGVAGEVTCTKTSLHIDTSDTKASISLDAVTAVDLQGPEWPRTYLYTGLATLAYGLVGGGLESGLSTIALIVGPVLLATGYWQRTSRLIVATSGRTYQLRSRDNALRDVAQVLRP